MIVLGVMMDRKGSADASIDHREEVAERLFHLVQKSITRKGKASVKFKTWSQVVVAVAMHGCRTWHLTRDIIHRIRAWELRYTRKILRLRPAPKLGEEYAGGLSYNTRTAGIFYSCCRQYGIKTMAQQVLEAVYGAGWKEASMKSSLCLFRFCFEGLTEGATGTKEAMGTDNSSSPNKTERKEAKKGELYKANFCLLQMH